MTGEEEINELEAYIQDQIKKLMEEVKKTDLYFVMVTNEIGLGVVPGYKLGRVYCDFVGRINQMLGKLSDEVYFVRSYQATCPDDELIAYTTYGEAIIPAIVGKK